MGETIKNLVAKIQEAIAVLRAISEIKAILAPVAEDMKAPIREIAANLDGLVAAFQGSDNTFDDKLIPAFQTLSAWLKRISA